MEEDLTKLFKVNVVSNIHIFNLFLPLIREGQVKKIINISTGNADLDPINEFDTELSPLYTISKAAMNVAVAKFSAQYKKEGVLFMSICPGMVDTGHHKDGKEFIPHILSQVVLILTFLIATPEQLQIIGTLLQKFTQYAPNFTGPASPDAAVRDVISVWEKASIENGDGGAFVSHYGNKQWL